MTKKDLMLYCKEKKIRPEFVTKLEEQGVKRANALYEMIQEHEKLLAEIREVIDEAVAMRGAYFFTPPDSAGNRRSYEKKHSKGPITWLEGGDEYYAKVSVSCSCKNVYCSTYYKKNGEYKNLTVIKNSYARLCKEFYTDEK